MEIDGSFGPVSIIHEMFGFLGKLIVSAEKLFIHIPLVNQCTVV
jgi:hypothetical protein